MIVKEKKEEKKKPKIKGVRYCEPFTAYEWEPFLASKSGFSMYRNKFERITRKEE